jgi:hypothetical protein
LTPSPALATRRPSAWSRPITSALSFGIPRRGVARIVERADRLARSAE